MIRAGFPRTVRDSEARRQRGYDMTSDIALAVGDGTRRMTYAELAAARGISVAAARRLTLRHRWARHTGNDGFVRVSVPLTALEKVRKAAAHDDSTTRHSDSTGRPTSDTVSDTTREIVSLLAQIADLQARLDASEADRRRLTELLVGTTDTTREVEGLRTQVAELLRRLDAITDSPAVPVRRRWWRFGR
jgi:hypothetical protein